MSKKKCPICGAEMKIDTSAVCTSIPPKYRCVCPSCNCLDFIETSEYDQYKEEPSLPPNLDEAVQRIAYDVCKQLPNGEDKDGIVYYAILAAIAGAEWMAGQGVNTDFEVCKLANRAWLTPIDEKKFAQDIFDNFAAGDNVVVQIRKK